MNLYEQQRSNRRRTWAVMVAFVLFLVIIGAGFDAFYLGVGGPVPVGSILALLVGSGSAAVGYFAGDSAVLAASGAKPLDDVTAAAPDEQRLMLKQLDNVVEEMAIAAGISKPRVFLVADPDPNAFATGRGPGRASIVVTQGLLDTVNREELQGVVAHEMSHIRNLDVRLMTIVAALVGAVGLLSEWAKRGAWGGRGRRDDDRKSGAAGAIFLVIWVVAILLAPLIAQLLAMMVSRRREFLADASGAELTRNPLALATALEKIDGAVAPTQSIKQGTAHLCIADPLGRPMNAREGRWSDLFASHPPMAVRIAALRQMAYQGGS